MLSSTTQQQHWARRLFTFANLFDFTMSTITGIAVGTYMIDMKESESQLDRIPLMAGRSNIAENFCPLLQQEYQRQLQLANNNNNHNSDDSDASSKTTTTTEYNMGLFTVELHEEEFTMLPQHKEVLKNPQDPNLQAYMNFIKNCKRRQKVQKRLLQQQRGGLGMTMMMHDDESSIAIPSPGVEAYEESLDVEEDDEHNDTFDENDDNNNWTSDQQVSSWVSDQEDDDQ